MLQQLCASLPHFQPRSGYTTAEQLDPALFISIIGEPSDTTVSRVPQVTSGIARPPLPSHIEIQVSGYVPFIDAGLDGHADLDLALPHPSSQLSHLVEHHPVLTGREQLWTPVHEEAVDVESEVDFDALIESFPVDSADLHPWSTQALDPIEAAPTTEATELTGEPDSQHSGLLGSSQLTEIRNVATPGTDANYILTPEKTTGTGKQP